MAPPALSAACTGAHPEPSRAVSAVIMSYLGLPVAILPQTFPQQTSCTRSPAPVVLAGGVTVGFLQVGLRDRNGDGHVYCWRSGVWYSQCRACLWPVPRTVARVIKIALPAGKANPAPPVGPALGAAGVNIMAFCKEYNAATQDKAGMIIPCEITVYEVRMSPGPARTAYLPLAGRMALMPRVFAEDCCVSRTGASPLSSRHLQPPF